MAGKTLEIEQPIDQVWERLQQLPTWEGIGGMHRLREAAHRDDGTLAYVRFSLDTPLGLVDDDAIVTPEVDSENRSMHVQTLVKGFDVTIDLRLSPSVDEPGRRTSADFTIDAEATTFLTRPLASTLRHTLESGIDRESERMVQRLETGHERA